MKTECTKEHGSFQALGRREIVTDFKGGTISSDGGVLLLREIQLRTNILQRFAQCFTDYRDQKRIEHSVLTSVTTKLIVNHLYTFFAGNLCYVHVSKLQILMLQLALLKKSNGLLSVSDKLGQM